MSKHAFSGFGLWFRQWFLMRSYIWFKRITTLGRVWPNFNNHLLFLLISCDFHWNCRLLLLLAKWQLISWSSHLNDFVWLDWGEPILRVVTTNWFCVNQFPFCRVYSNVSESLCGVSDEIFFIEWNEYLSSLVLDR